MKYLKSVQPIFGKVTAFLKTSDKKSLLPQFLFLSSLLNVIFLFLFFYFSVKETTFSQFEYQAATQENVKPQVRFTNTQSVIALCRYPFQNLVACLTQKESVEHGYTMRDLALAVLVRRDRFDLARALNGKIPSMRNLALNEKTSIILFSDLEDEDYQKIYDFLKIERYPFTNEGLFNLIKKQGLTQCEASLLKTFFISEEFILMEQLFKETHMTRRALLSLLLDAPWKVIADFTTTQKASLDLAPTKRRELLLSYLQYNSPWAASLLLIVERDYLLHVADNKVIERVLTLLPKQSKAAQDFAKALLNTPRGPRMHQSCEHFLTI